MKNFWELSLLHTSDLHGNYGALKRICQYRAEEILLDGGDALSGSNLVYRKHEPIIKVMNDCGYSAMAMGNREFSYYPSVLESRLKSFEFPLLALNLEDRKKRFSDFLKGFTIIVKNDLKLLIAGLTPIQYPPESFPASLTGFIFLPYAESIKKLFNSDTAQSCDLKIVLSHCGIDDDIKLAKQCPEIDIILGGHTHVSLERPLLINGVYVCHSGCLGKSIARYCINFTNGVISSVSVNHLGKEGK